MKKRTNQKHRMVNIPYMDGMGHVSLFFQHKVHTFPPHPTSRLPSERAQDPFAGPRETRGRKHVLTNPTRQFSPVDNKSRIVDAQISQ